MTPVEKFSVKPNSFKELRRIILIRSIPLMLLAMAAGLFMGRGQQESAGLYLMMIPMMLGALGVGVFISLKRQKEIFYSYMLTLNGESIIREQHNTAMISIPYSEVKEITKNSNGSFTIKGNSAINAIGVHAQIENYERLEQLLNEIKQISANASPSILQRFSGLITVLTLGLMVAVYVSNNKLVVGLCGATLLGFLGYSLYAGQKSKNIDKKTKRSLWLVLIVTISIIAVMYYKLLA